MQRSKPVFLIALFISASLLLAACQSATPTASPTAAVSPTATVEAVTPTPTVPPEKTLIICMGVEPSSLYIYGQPTQSMWSVLEAIYDGPIDQLGYSSTPVILEDIPSLEKGGVKVEPVTVKAGDLVVDADGDLANLAQGVAMRPSGCTSRDCVVTYNGTDELQVDQVKVTFTLRSGLKWSDGQPLTADDSVFSYTLAADKDTPVSKYLTDRTETYQAGGDTSLTWTGVPGFLNDQIANTFWLPLPRHILGGKSAADLLQADESAVKPIGWGPYQLNEWVKGDHILLDKNPNYFRSAEGLPQFDHVVYRFLGQNVNVTLTALLNGECDVVDQTANLDEQLKGVVDLDKTNQIKAVFGQGPEWEHIDFGIKPASYDDGYNPAAGDVPDIFGDVRTRQAFAYCLDRQQVNDQILLGTSGLLDSYLPSNHPFYDPNVQKYTFDPAAGVKLLEEVGWKDADNDPSTPRVAAGVQGIPDGTQLEVSYLTTKAPLRVAASDVLVKSLAQCGIKANVTTMNPGDLFAPGPDGLFFGRKFDLVQYQWQDTGRPNCSLYASSQIPTAENHWVGVNVSGFSNPEYDAACAAAMSALPGQTAYQENINKTQEIFSQQLPALPLYLRLRVAATRPDFCGLTIDPSARSEMWNIEAFDIGSGCKP